LYGEGEADALRGIYGAIWGNTRMGWSKKCRKLVKGATEDNMNNQFSIAVN